jgi:hypothetical protein
MDQSMLLYGGIAILAFLIICVSAMPCFYVVYDEHPSSLFFELWAFFRDGRLGEDD